MLRKCCASLRTVRYLAELGFLHEEGQDLPPPRHCSAIAVGLLGPTGPTGPTGPAWPPGVRVRPPHAPGGP
ncbi:hypothetical protein JCM4814A_19890 [Streptomyces phaeofaciens JCM 4814]